MKLNKLVLKFVSISFSILVMLLVVIGLIKLGSFCYDFGYFPWKYHPNPSVQRTIFLA